MYTRGEISLFKKLSTPAKVQDFLDSLPINFELDAETYYSPRNVLVHKKAHCFEGAVLAAAIFEYHGAKPLLLDLRVKKGRGDVDHVVALYLQNGKWGAVSKTNHYSLRWRDAIYPSVYALALSYFHEYFDDKGRKNLRAFAGPVDLSLYPKPGWQTSPAELDDLVDYVDKIPGQLLVDPTSEKHLRKVTALEIAAGKLTEWKAHTKGIKRQLF